MAAALPVAIALLAQAAAATPDTSATVYGPNAPPPAKAAPTTATATATAAATERSCVPTTKDAESRVIVVCAPKPQGYRIDPDVLAARKAKREMMAGRPHNPHETFKDNSCKVVGPAPCMDAPMINLLAAGATAAEMADRLSKGQEIGSMFVTDPQPSEYQLYLEAKKEREAKEAAKAAKVKAATQTAKPAPPRSAAQ